MAYKQEIDAVAARMPGVPCWKIEAGIDAGTINPDNYVAEEDQ